MQNKKLFLLVGALALATFLVISYLQPSGMSTLEFKDFGRSADNNYPTEAGLAEPMMLDRGAGSSYIYPPYYGDDALDVAERMYVYSSSYDVVVNNVPEYLNQLRDYILSVDGRVISYHVGKYDRTQSGYLQARVPTAVFDETKNRVTNGVKDVVRENVDSYDATGQVVGSAERVASLEGQLEERLAQLAELEAGSAAYVQMQNQITRLEQQLEQARQALESQEQNVQYSNIYVTAADSNRHFDGGARPDPLTEFWDAVESLGDSLVGLGYLLIWIVVYAVIWLPVVLVARWIWRWFKR